LYDNAGVPCGIRTRVAAVRAVSVKIVAAWIS